MPITGGNGIVINIEAEDTATPKIDKTAQAILGLHKNIDDLRVRTEAYGAEAVKLAQRTDILNNVQFKFNQLMDAGRNIMQIATKVYQNTVGESIKYANEVRNIVQISGESAQATSRLIQVADDYKITSNDLMTAQRALAKEGLSLNIETMAKLSDEYIKLNTGAERQAFLTEHLGRSSAQFAEMMSQGSAAIMEKSASVSAALILDQKALDNARKYEMALDDLGDQLQAIKTSAGNALIPTLTTAATSANQLMAIREATGSWAATWKMMFEGMELSAARAETAIARLYRLSRSQHNLGLENYTDTKQQEIINQANENVANSYTAMAYAYADIAPSVDSVTQSFEELAAAQEEVRKGIIDRTAFEVAFTGAKTAADTAQIAMKMMGTEIQGLGTEGALVWNGFLVATGQISSEAAAQFAKVYTIVEEAKRLLGLGVPIKFVVEYMVNASGGGTFQTGGGGGGNTGPNGEPLIYDNAQGKSGYYEEGTGRWIWSKAGGGAFSGWAMVGDSPGGGRTPYTEYVYAPHGAVVYNQAQMSGQAPAPSAAIGGIIPPAVSNAASGDMSMEMREFARYIVDELRRTTG